MALTWNDPADPSLEEVMHGFPGWTGKREISGRYSAVRAAGNARVSGEDPLDLRDQMKRAEALAEAGPHEAE